MARKGRYKASEQAKMAENAFTNPYQTTGKLYLLPVPLSAGSATDVLPERNMAVMRGLRHFVVENTRTARRFLRACFRDFPIDASSFTELNEHTSASEAEAMLEPLLRGEDMGLLSEAGCPAIADPGAALVAAAQKRGLQVVPLVGPSSILLSLMASGFDGQSFAFNGYLPVDDHQRAAALRNLERLAAKGQTQIFIETPYRNNRMVKAAADTLGGDTHLCVACDLTGEGESVVTLPAREWRRRTYDYNKTPCIFLIGQPSRRP